MGYLEFRFCSVSRSIYNLGCGVFGEDRDRCFVGLLYYSFEVGIIFNLFFS